jgi:UPF0755 protein
MNRLLAYDEVIVNTVADDNYYLCARRMKQSTKKRIAKGLWAAVVTLLLVVATMGYFIYQRLYTPNIQTADDGFLYISTGSDFEDVVQLLEEKKWLKDEATFRWTAIRMNYTDHIKPGRYKLASGMSNKEVVGMLRSGRQVPVKLVFTSVRTKIQFAQKIGEQLEVAPDAVVNLLEDRDYLKKLGFTPDNVMALFLPNTYEFYWTTSADQFITRMKREYDKYWNDNRKRKAAAIGLTPVQVTIVASIVQQESNKEDEKPVIAGVYLNRYRKGWKLEADPTLVFALGDFTVRRVLNSYKAIDSPYNTYMYSGLPPGPICVASQRSIDAVLNATKHNFMYFCAREDFSGYHNFAASYSQHLTNARKFQQALNRRGIRS